MAIEVRKRPYSFCWSGNPVHYELYSSLAAADPAIYFAVMVRFESPSGTITDTAALDFSPVAGFAEVDIQDLLECFLNFDLPGFALNEKTVWPALQQSGEFYLRFREIHPSNPAPSWDDSEADYKSFVFKGGISTFKYQGNNFFTNYFDADVPRRPRPFFTWQQPGRLAHVDERMYLAFLLIDVVPVSQLKIVLDCEYVDGSGSTDSMAMPSQVNRIYYVPAGATQWGVNLSKDLLWWQLTIVNQDPVDPYNVSKPFRYYADNRNDYNDKVLHYRNSLGGLDSVSVRGVINVDLEHDYTEVQRIQRPDYFSGPAFDAQREHAGSKELEMYRGDVGHLEKEEQDRLRDVYQKRELWWCIAKKWYPVTVVTKGLKLGSSESTKWSLPIDFCLAHEGNRNYTPNNVDLGEGTFTSNVCRAYMGNVLLEVTAGAAGFKTVKATFQEIDPDDNSTQIRWRVLKQSDESVILPWKTEAFVSPLTFTVPDTANIFFEVRAVCSNAVAGKIVRTAATVFTPGSGTNPNPQPPVNPPLRNGRIVNHTNINTPFQLTRNGVPGSSGYLGANSTTDFDLQPGAGLTITLYTSMLSPSQATLMAQSTFYPGYINGRTVTFYNVGFLDDVKIDVY